MTAREPLAYRMAPRTLDEYVGQKHILGSGKLLRRMIEADQLRSLLLFGPPGTGKTSLARVIARVTHLPFHTLNAVTAGVADLKRVIEDARNLILAPQGRVILFIDEIHRFNKLQQDALLPAVEDGSVILIGATTENPFFAVNKALVSRATVFALHPLSEEEILQILQAALQEDRGLGALPLEVDPLALQFWANRSNGDVRIALNALDLASASTPPDGQGVIHIDLAVAEDCIQKRSTAFDATGEGHYDTISALIKSVRGGDPDAALLYLAIALHGGEDLLFLARRLVILAAEDIGLANPTALLMAQAVQEAVAKIGMPEARILLGEAVVFLATSPKSNSAYLAIDAALDGVRKRRTGEIPMHLRNAPVSGMEALGYHDGYLYPHDFPEHFVPQSYLPEEWKGTQFYNPGELGYEGKQIVPRLERWRALQAAEEGRSDEASEVPQS